MVVFELTMPNRGSWNGKWSGENDRHIGIRYENKVPKEIIGKDFFYRWDDGWTACVSVYKLPAPEARKLERKSAGFCGYEWMISSLLINKEIRCDR